MDRLVTVVVLGHEIPVTVFDAKSDEEAKALVIDEAAKSFHVRSITALPKRKPGPTLWMLIADAFKSQRNHLKALPAE